MNKFAKLLIAFCPLLVFLILLVLYFKYVEEILYYYFDCGCFTHGINYNVASIIVLSLVNFLYIVLFVRYAGCLRNKSKIVYLLVNVLISTLFLVIVVYN